VGLIIWLAKNLFATRFPPSGPRPRAKVSNKAASGAPEDQLRAALIRDLAAAAGMAAGTVNMVGESSLSDLATRPDYAVVVCKALVGFIEVKAPGKGADPRRFTDAHDKEQWKSSSLCRTCSTPTVTLSASGEAVGSTMPSFASTATLKPPAPRSLPLGASFLSSPIS
jgi:hypothetical protein